MFIPPHLFTRVIAGIAVPNTLLINSSIEIARNNLPDDGYNHIMRSWLNGQAIINKLPTVNRTLIDQEAFAVATILHDLGWSENPEYVSQDKRFEVDGAFAARSFIQQHDKNGHWPPQRLQLVWDLIALHTTSSIARFKEPEVAIGAAGIWTDLIGPSLSKKFFGDIVTVEQEQWEAIVKVFPNKGLRGYVRDVFTGLCRVKPDTTYDNGASDYGEVYLPGFTRVGHRGVDLLDIAIPEKKS